MARSRVSWVDKWGGFSEGKIKEGVHTYGLTHCLHIVFGMHFANRGVHPFSAKLLNHIRNRCAHRSTNLSQPFTTSIL